MSSTRLTKQSHDKSKNQSGSQFHASLETLPAYLRRYTVTQQNQYTPQDQAAWRFIMRQSRAYFKDHAVAIYLQGLEQTGITTEHIPLIEEMDRKLARLGWGAVPVRGFIPPAAFLDFQARKILPIAADMRTAEHIHYTPAPDIVHEAAGHAPIIADPEYSDYLTQYAAMAQKAIFSQEDLELYEAIRTLSDVKENPDCTPAMIKDAEARLALATAKNQFTSEANKVARMNWWTVEYGLLGPLNNPKIYGAGLLSSVGESQACLSPKVKKVRLSVDCVETSYDITEPQPQLFVGEDLQHLTDVLHQFEQKLSYVRGGWYGLDQGLQGRTVVSVCLDSGISVSGQLQEYLKDQRDPDEKSVTFLKFSGPTQICFDGKELACQGVTQHPAGFSSPLGRIQQRSDKPLHLFSDDDLKGIGVELGKTCELLFTTGFKVQGKVAQLLRKQGKLVLIKWQQCSVFQGSQLVFDPSWGDFDMVTGEQVTSVYGGPTDREAYGSHDVGQATTTPNRQSPYDQHELDTFALFKEMRTLRELLRNGQFSPTLASRCEDMVNRISADPQANWLLQIESIELMYLLERSTSPTGTEAHPARAQALAQQLQLNKTKYSANIQWLIERGLALAPLDSINQLNT